MSVSSPTLALMTRTLAALAAATLLLAGCGGSDEAAAPEVDWSQFAPAVKDRIDAAVESADCGALQEEFDAADGNGQTELMEYVDKQLEDAGCY